MNSEPDSPDTAERPLRAAMIGGGLNSAVGRVHEIAMRMDSKFELVAGCFSRHEDVNRETGRAYRVAPERLHATAEALFEAERGQVDVIVIAAPSDVHAPLIHAALDHDYIVITDKPTVATVAEAEALLTRLGPETDRLFTIFNYTGYSAVREMKRIIGDGEIGTVFKLMIEMPQDGFLRMNNQNSADAIQDWRLKDGEICGLSLDLFTHIHSLALYLTGAHPADAWAKMRSISQVAPDLIDEVDAIVEYDTGMIMNAWYGKAALGYRNGLRIRAFGTEGSLQWLQMNPEEIMMADRFGDMHFKDRLSMDATVANAMRYNRFKGGHPAGFIEAFANYYSDIAGAMHAPANPIGTNLIGLQAAVEGLKLARDMELAHPRH